MGFRQTMTVVGMENDSGVIQTKNDSGELQMEPTVMGKNRQRYASGGQRQWWACDELQMENEL